MRIARTLVASAVLAAWFCGPVLAREYAVGSIRVLDPWTRATAAAGSSAVGFLTITNDGAKPERLTGADCPIAASTAIQSTTNAMGVMHVHPVSGVDIAPGGTVKLRPGGLHLTLAGTKHRLARGDTITCRLRFRDAGKVDVQLLIRGANAIEPLMGPIEP